jgi:hypothetical protein
MNTVNRYHAVAQRMDDHELGNHIEACKALDGATLPQSISNRLAILREVMAMELRSRDYLPPLRFIDVRANTDAPGLVDVRANLD